MKKLFNIILAIGLLITCKSEAQTRTKITPNITQGEFIDFGGTNLVPVDSLQVTDSIAYILPILHNNDVSAYHTWYWKKVGSGTATITLNFFQANDPTNFFPVKAGVAGTNYSKSYTLSADTWSEVNFARDTARISGRYLKVQFITSNTANVKGYLFNRVKTYSK